LFLVVAFLTPHLFFHCRRRRYSSRKGPGSSHQILQSLQSSGLGWIHCVRHSGRAWAILGRFSSPFSLSTVDGLVSLRCAVGENIW
jgi:hypothetical protein